MRVLIACEESQVVCIEFRALEEYTGKFGMTRRCDNGTIQNH